eukprot:1716519-Rhodomonas_salina.1
MQRASPQDLQCSKTCNTSCKGLIFKTSNASRPTKLHWQVHAKGFSSRPAMLVVCGSTASEVSFLVQCVDSSV